MTSLNSQNCVQMRQGLGKMNSETPKPEQMICHSTMTATSSSQGDQRSICFLFFMHCAVQRRQPRTPDVDHRAVHFLDRAERRGVGHGLGRRVH